MFRVLELTSPNHFGNTALVLSPAQDAQQTTRRTIEELHDGLFHKSTKDDGKVSINIPKVWILLRSFDTNDLRDSHTAAIDAALLESITKGNAEEQVLQVAADVLQSTLGAVRAAKSFTNVGGTARSAIKLQTRCFDKGILLSLASILADQNLEQVAQSAILLLDEENAGIFRKTAKAATDDQDWAKPLQSWGITELQCRDTVSQLLKLDLSGRLGPIGTEPFPVQKSLAVLLHAILLSLKGLQPNRPFISFVVKSCYTGKHKALRADLSRLGNIDSDLPYFETLLKDAELVPGTSSTGTAELIVQYEEGDLCDQDGGPREPEDASAYIPSVFVVNIHKEDKLLLLEFQSPRQENTQEHLRKWAESCNDLLEPFTTEPDETAAFKFWAKQMTDLAPTTFPKSSTTHKEAESLLFNIDLTGFTPARRYSLVQAAWAVVLGRYNDAGSACFDRAIARSNAPIFVEEAASQCLLPMRVELSDTMLVSELVKQMEGISRDMSQHSQFGREYFAQLTDDEREACRMTSALIIDSDMDLEDLDAMNRRLIPNSPEYPLLLYIKATQLGTDFKFRYDAASITALECTALQNQLLHVISQLSTMGNEPLASISIAGPWDLKQAMEWNGPPMPIYHQCMHHLITDRVMRDPEREAICTLESSMTYAELEEEATILAVHLVSLGIPAQTVVPICFASTKWAIVAMIGVMKAGCIFMPLDPAHPESRRRGLVDQVQADTVIASGKTAAMCQEICPNVVVLDDLFIAQQMQKNDYQNISMRACSPTDAAYILFTSGSTGVPKGVQVEHSAASSSIINFGKKHKATKETRMLSFASYAFDACIYEIFVPLVLGGTVCIPPEEHRLENISPFLAAAHVTAALLTPSYVKTLDPEKIPSLDTLIIAGEAATLDVVETWQKRVRLINCYGPTETCVSVMTYTYDPEFKYTASTRIGTNVHGNCWIVEPDNHNRLTPIGCTGELIVQSHAMAREYYKAPEKTAASFISNVELFPASTPMRTARCYKTGDLVKYNPDGTLEYQGRKDNQIKLRGQRLEPSEIEHVLNLADDRIQSTAVHLTKRSAGNSLVAFVDFKEPLDSSQVAELRRHDLIPMFPAMEELLTHLRSYVASRLPKFMVPSFFVPLNEMPFVTSMKIDRKRLQGLADSLTIEELSKYSAASSITEVIPPTTPAEFAMRELWAEILNLDPESISRDNSFLHIGGDSISAIHLSSMARKRGLQLSTAAIFRDSRLSVMAQIAKPLSQGAETNAPIKPFGILSVKNLEETLSQLREHCSLSDGESIEDAYPCTPLQEGLLALGIKHPGSYIGKFVYRLSDAIDIDRFKLAWESICRTCENQKVRIVRLGTASIQTLVQGDFAWEPTENMSLNRFMDATRDIEMSYGSKLSRSALIREASGAKYFVWITHHAVFDGWTVMLIMNALKELYQGTSILSFVPYSGFVQYATQLDMTEAHDYWKKQLHGAQPATFPVRGIATDDEDVPKKVTRIATYDMPFPESTRTEITKGTILRSAWALALARYGSTDDVCFGATASGRNANVEGIANMTGTVIGTVPVRIKIDPASSIKNFLIGVQNQALEMAPYEQYGFQNIAKIGKDAKAASDVTSLLIVQPQQQVEVIENSTAAFMKAASEKEYSMLDAVDGYYTFPVVLQCIVYPDHVTLDFTYDCSVVSAQQMEALSHHFEHIAHQLLAQDDSKIGDIEISGAWDLQKAISYNSHVEEFSCNNCLHNIVSQRAREDPGHQAIYSTEICMTYAELDHASSLLACYLMELGVTLDTVVPICVEKSIWAVIAMLGIMKAGGVFMPMDPTHPFERRKALVEQVQAKFSISSVESATTCENMAQTIVVLSTSFLKSLESKVFLDTSAFNSDASAVAYILFTSGSTGQPKGIVVEHTAICSAMITHAREFGLSKSSRVLQFASYVFDISVDEILATLIHGGTVCIPSGTERMQDITGFINKAQTDVAMLTPSFVTTFGPNDVPNLKVLVLGGEAPTKTSLSTWQPHLKLLNAYAPAECCIYLLVHTYKSTKEAAAYLGKGLHSYCWIVEPDNHNKLAPIGCVGELVLQSNSIGRGYVNDPKRTDEVFLRNLPCIPEHLHRDGHKFYKSGDLVRYDANGLIEYLGRKDTQVKLRGQRIELGEIEYHILQLVPDAKYVTVEVIRRGRREALIAFISFSDTDDENTDATVDDGAELIRETTPALKAKFQQIRAKLESKVPPYMLPSLFMALYRTPFLNSMKVNRKMLRSIIDDLSPNDYSQLSLSNDGPKESVQSEMEAKIRDMWAEVLEISQENIGRSDSFFQAGGDSISALTLSSLAEKQGIIISIGKMFTNPMLKDMAEFARIEDTTHAATLPFELLAPSEASTIIQDACQRFHLANEEGIDDIFPCTAFQEGVIALSMRQPGAYKATVVYNLANGVSVDGFKRAWEHTVEKCSNLRTRIFIPTESTDGKAFQAIMSFKPSWEDTRGHDLSTMVDSMKSLSMGYGSSLCRYAILDGETPKFILSMHHAVYDLWSMHLILSVLQDSFANKTDMQVLPFSKFVKHIMHSDIEETQQYWRQQLEGAKMVTFPRIEENAQKRKADMREKTAKIKMANSVKTNVTKATLLQAAWGIVLARHNETNDICYGTAVTGRLASVPGVTSMIGPTLSSVPLRCKLDPSLPASQFLSQVQECTTAMIPHEQYGLLNISKLSHDAKLACNFSTLLIIQPYSQVATLSRHKAAVLEEDKTEATLKLLGDGLENYFDNPLIINCLISDDSVELIMYYDSNIVSEKSMEALEHHFGRVTKQLELHPDAPIATISLLDDWDQQLALESQMPMETNPDCLHWLVEKQIDANPHRTAISAWDGELSYQQLGAAAAELSSRLRSYSIHANDLIICCLGRSKWSVVATIAVQLAGAAAVPVNAAQIHQMRDRVGSLKPKLILTESSVEDKVRHLDILTVPVDSQPTQPIDYLQATSTPQPSPAGTCLVLLPGEVSETSFATKFSHSAASASVVAYATAIALDTNARMLLSAPEGSFLNIVQIFATLSTGGCVCIPADEIQEANIAKHVSELQCSAAILDHQLAQRAQLDEMPTINLLGIPGDFALKARSENWDSRINVHAFWGMNESLIYAWKPLGSVDAAASYGRPLCASFWIVEDEALDMLTPLGCIGEVIIQSPALFDGYLNDTTPATTNFMENLEFLPGDCGKRGLRTGDLVRRSFDGGLEYIGRRGARRDITTLAKNISTNGRVQLQPEQAPEKPILTPIEEQMRVMWANLLDISPREIDLQDSFLSIGGDSISAIQLVTMARKQGITLSIASIFKDPRLSEVAASAVLTSTEGRPDKDLVPFSLLPSVPSDHTIHELKQQCYLGQNVVVEDIYPCTKLQEGLMALSVTNPGSYVAQYGFRLAKGVDIEAFQVAWERTIETSPILRTRIVPIQGTFLQAVFKENPFWEHVAGDDLMQYVARDKKIAMGYGSRLSRYALVAQKYFVWTVHHAVVDGWSIDILMERMKSIYQRIQIPAITPFTSFIKYTMSMSDKDSTHFWAKQLEGAICTQFPPDNFEKHKPTSYFSRTIRHSAPTNPSITMATVLRCAWSLLLATYCGTDDVCFGMALSGRQAPVNGIESIAGPTIATVPVRIVVPSNATVSQFLRAVQDQTLDMIPHEQFGLQNIGKINSDAREACNFSSLMVIQPRKFGGNTTTGDALAERVDLEGNDAVGENYFTYPLVVQFHLMESEFEISILYSPALLSEQRVATLTYHMEHIVTQLLGSADRLVKEVAVAGPWDLQKAKSWNQEDQTVIERCVHDFFADHVQSDPDREAIFTTSRSVSYSELDKMSTQLAAYLKRLGVGPEIMVPICMEKSIWPTICIVAIMKAGGAFMPMDPTHPYEYLQALVEQANAQVVLTSANSVSDCLDIAKHVVPISDSLSCFEDDESEAQSALNQNRATPDNPAYVIFSSGSTGTPKGVVVEHSSFSSSLTGHGQRLGLSTETRALQFSNHIWDVITIDILTVLAYGGTVCVPSEHERLHRTVEFINEANCNFAFLTPSFLRTMHPSQVPTIRTVGSGGEAMTKDVLLRWVNAVDLLDGYGPAEASCITSIHRYTSPSELGGTIGRPVHNGTWIVDLNYPDRLAPIGCEGELIVQGPAVARGYLNKPSLTAQSFSPEAPFLPAELNSRSNRFYWTGDLVKYNDDGNLVYLGRRDAQIKLRGQRIELGHIESQIQASSADISSAVVEVIHKGTPSATLVALVEWSENEGAPGDETDIILAITERDIAFVKSLKGKLSLVLPGYMIPGYFIPVTQIPKNRAAKTDRKLLRQTVESLSAEVLKTYLVSSGAEFREVVNEAERLVRDAWASVLRLRAEDISADDNFYDIGGDSIAIITLLKRIQAQFGVHLGLSIMNSKTTTVAQMAKFVTTRTMGDGESSVDVRKYIAHALSKPWVETVNNSDFVSTASMPSGASVFLTGGTGFLGTQLLRSLLENKDFSRVVALVRAKSVEDGRERLRKTAEIAGWWRGEFMKRVEVWVGNLEETRLGLTDGQWAQLSGAAPADRIDAIIHNGAVVNWNADYEKLQKANVGSVLDLLQAVVESKHATRFVFVSGGASVDHHADQDSVAEDMNKSIGYCQTKYVAESVVYRLAARLPSSQNRISVFKPGMIIGTAAEGVANLDDFLWRFVAASARIRLYPQESVPGYVPVCDSRLVALGTIEQITVDKVSAFVDMSTSCGLSSSDFWDSVNRELDEPCQPTDWETWLERAFQDMNVTGEKHVLYPVQHFVSEGGISGPKRLSAPNQLDLELAVGSNVRYLREVGFINDEKENDGPLGSGVLRRGGPRY